MAQGTEASIGVGIWHILCIKEHFSLTAGDSNRSREQGAEPPGHLTLTTVYAKFGNFIFGCFGFYRADRQTESQNLTHMQMITILMQILST